MATATALVARPARLNLPAVMLGAGLALFAGAMARRLFAAAVYGPICSSHGGGWLLHCPACQIAGAMVAIATVSAITAGGERA